MSTTVELGDGTQTSLEAWGEGPAILCVHGIAGSRMAWERFGRHFAGRFRTYAYDQRGHGDSAAITGPMTHARSVADAQAVAAALDSAPVAIVGHSWGGAIAILAGLELPVRAVVAVDPMLRVTPRTFEEDYANDTDADIRLEPAAREAELRKRLSSWHTLDIEGKIHAMHAMRTGTIHALGRENDVDGGGWDLRPRLRAYPKTLLIAKAGPDDSVMDAQDIAFVLSEGGRNVRVAAFDDQGHNLHRTAFERFTAEVEPVLAAAAKSAST